ncbi:MAG: hypothetical protein AAF192_19660, partial [Pseudomonadota bacterium]
EGGARAALLDADGDLGQQALMLGIRGDGEIVGSRGGGMGGPTPRLTGAPCATPRWATAPRSTTS